MRAYRAQKTGGGEGRRAAVLALLVAVLVGALAMGSAGPAGAVTPDWQTRMLDKVNAVRAAAGVAPLHLCRSLQRSAEAYAKQMARTATFGHQGPDGRMPSERMAAAGYRGTRMAENIGAGQGTVVRVMRQWRASPGHYAAMIDPRLHHVGFGYAKSGRAKYPTYWVQDYGTGGSC